MTLRDRLIEAAAPAIHANDPAYSPPYWSDCSEDMKVWYRAQASQALDAFLDVLAEHRGDWIDEAYPSSHPALHKVRCVTASNLVAVLRGDE